MHSIKLERAHSGFVQRERALSAVHAAIENNKNKEKSKVQLLEMVNEKRRRKRNAAKQKQERRKEAKDWKSAKDRH